MIKNFAKDLQVIIDQMPMGDSLSESNDLKTAREMVDLAVSDLNAQADTEGLIIKEKCVNSYEEGIEVPVRMYIPTNIEGKVPGIIYLHGGGFVTGSLNSEHAIAVDVAKRVGAVVVSVDYRLAPEHKYPAGLYDSYGVLNWMSENAEDLSIDKEKIIVMGHSAGGGMSASVALMSRDLNGPKIALQFLGIPELDDRLNTVSMKTFDDTPLWTNKGAKISWSYYLGEGVKAYDWASPERVEDLSGLPKTVITVAEYDPLRDEALNYAKRLLEQGVSVDLKHYRGTFHGSFVFKMTQVGLEQYDDIFRFLKNGLDY